VGPRAAPRTLSGTTAAINRHRGYVKSFLLREAETEYGRKSSSDRHVEGDSMTAKPNARPPGLGEPVSDPGRLGIDDRGNVTWEWADSPDLLADDEIGASQRVRALLDPSLEISEDEGPRNPLKGNPKGLKKGYNPYNSGALLKQSWKRSKNLRELSKWIELRRKLAERKDQD